MFNFFLFVALLGIIFSHEQPLIGILSIPSNFKNYKKEEYSYVFKSYIDFLESLGAKIVILKYTWSI